MMDSSAALLVVDDNEDNRYTLARRLNREGYKNLTTATNGREALERLTAKTFDLVLLDVMMPDMNGYEVLEHVKANPSLSDVPIIMISALDEIESVVRCIELGAEDYLSKPFNPTLLRARVGALLEKKRLRDDVRNNLARLEEEMGAARALQLGMLPRDFPACSPAQPVAVHALMQAAREVGGDLYDCFYTDDQTFCFLVGDVSGKGASAAMFMARTRSLVRMTAALWREWRADEIKPAELAETVNRELCQNNDERMFVTLFLGLLDTRSGVLSFINAGHPAPHLLRSGVAPAQIDAKPDLPLGVRRAAKYQGRSLAIEPGDAIFVCSDGVFEALNEKGELFSIERLNRELGAVNGADPAEIVRVVKNAVDTFAGVAPKADDVTALALRWHPTQHNRAVSSVIRSVDCVLHNDLLEIAIVRDALDQIGKDFDVPARALMHLQVALDEVVSNVVKYSWPDGGKHEFLVRISVTATGVALDVFDDGRPFDPRQASEPAPLREGQRPRPGGVGIHMTKKLVDNLTYERVGGRNHTSLIKNCAIGAALREDRV
jgi:sigma-B regulation protein RsbU (phosphoserine phosphatase)